MTAVTTSQSAPASPWLWRLGVVLLALTVLVYRPVFQAEYVNYDDQAYVTENKHVLAGLTWAGVQWAFTTSEMGSWHPLTWLSHMLDVEWFGVNAGAHHAVNLGFHAANSLLLLLLLWRLTGQVGASFFAAALFALHPTHVESVAWVSERKDVLSTFFGLLSLLAYVHYARQPATLDPQRSSARFLTSGPYWLVILFLALGLMSKPMLVTWPLLMLLLDFWPLRRREWGSMHPATWLPLVAEKLPLLLLVGGIAVVTVLTQHGSAAVLSLAELPLSQRLANTLNSLGIYVMQFVWPAGLAPFYPLPEALASGRVLLVGLSLVVLSGVAVWGARRWPWLTVGWFWYLIAVFPVSGVLQAGWQAHADRYLYVPSIGLGWLVTWGGLMWWQNRAQHRDGLVGLGLSGLAVLGWLTFQQAERWQNTERLFTHALQVTRHNFIAHQSLGEELLKQNRMAEAREHFTTALALNPQLPTVRNNLAVMLLQEENFAAAEPEFAAVLREQPKFQLARFNHAKALEGLHRYAAAREAYQAFLADQPDDVEAWLGLVRCLTREGRFAEAVAQLQHAIARLPQVTSLHTALAVARLGQGDFAAAVAAYGAGLAANPDSVELLNNLAWLQATHPQAGLGGAKQAVVHAERASAVTEEKIPFVLGTLAAAYAAAERFPDAVQTAERAIQLARDLGQVEVAQRNEALLQLYRTGRAYREPVSPSSQDPATR